MKPHHARALLAVYGIASVLVFGYGFHVIDQEQSSQDKLTHQLAVTKESTKANCHRLNVLRASTNVNSLAEFEAWTLFAKYADGTVVGRTNAAKHALLGVLHQTWIPLTDCTIPPPHGVEGYPVPSAVLFSVELPPHSALFVPPETP